MNLSIKLTIHIIKIITILILVRSINHFYQEYAATKQQESSLNQTISNHTLSSQTEQSQHSKTQPLLSLNPQKQSPQNPHTESPLDSQSQPSLKSQTQPPLRSQTKMSAPSIKLPSVFISHGLVGETLKPSTTLFQCLKKYSEDNKLYQRVKTAIIISGHWEENNVTVNLNPTPKIVHDHPSEWLFKFNFSLETNLELAKQIKQRLEDNQIVTKTTTTEGVDHGGWGGLFSLYDINKQQNLYNQNKQQYAPKIVQVSLHSGMDTAYHHKIGQILDQFRNEDTMIISSGASTHSFTYMNHPEFTTWSKEWEKWLIEVVTNKDEKYRKDQLFAVKKHKMYKYIHHSDDHFMPLLVALGTSKNPGELICLEQQFTFMCSCFSFS